MGARILSTGSSFPQNSVSNENLPTGAYLAPGAGKRFHSNTETSVQLGSAAVRDAMESGKISPDEIDGIICFSGMPDFAYPGDVVLIQKELGIKAACMTMDTACASFITGMKLANSLIESGLHKRILILMIMNWSSRGIPDVAKAVGDGAAAVIVENSEHASFIASREETFPDYFDFITLPSPYAKNGDAEHLNPLPHFQFSDSSRHARFFALKATETADQLLTENNVKRQSLWFLAHQTGSKMLETWASKLGVPAERILDTFEEHGNMSAVNIPAILDRFTKNGKINRGDELLFFAPGAGLHVASMVWRY